MDAEGKQLLQENIALAKENNQLLKRIVHFQRLTTIYRCIYWGIILFSTLGVYYFIQPYLGNMLNVYTGGVSGTSNIGDIIKSFGDKEQIQNLINSIK